MTVDVFEIKPENKAEVIVECSTSGEVLLSLNETQTEPSQYRFETDVKVRYSSPGYSRLLMRFVNDNTAEEQCGGLNFYTQGFDLHNIAEVPNFADFSLMILRTSRPT